MQETAPANATTPGIFISVVAPCFNESSGLEEFYNRTTAVLNSLRHFAEIVLIDDGSQDATWNVIKQLASRDPRVRGVKLSRNHGHQLALTAGLEACRGNRILIIDADLQDPPELLEKMLDQMKTNNCDVVYGRRRLREGETIFKKGTAFVFYRILSILSETPIPCDAGDFRLMSRRVLDVILSMPEQHRFLRGMVSWVGFRQEPIDYDRAPRLVGQTGWPLKKMVRFAINAITSFSIRPLKIASMLSLGLAGLSSLFLIHIVLAKFYFGKAINGWTSLMTAVLLVGSLQLFVLGIIGEYIGRLFIESKRRPLYIISETTSPDGK